MKLPVDPRPIRARLRARLLACAASVALLAGCAVGPNFLTPEGPVETSYLVGRGPNGANGDSVAGRKIEHGADISAEWWEAFRSRKLSDLIRDGLTHNADVGAAEAALRVAQANALAQRGALFPVVGAGFDANRQKISNIVSSNVASNAELYSLHTAQVTVAFVPDIWGGTRRQIESADALAEMQFFQREGTYLTLSSNIALAAVEEARLLGQIAVLRRSIELQSQLLGILKKQNDEGQIAMTDVVAQESAVAQAKLLLVPVEKQFAQQHNLIAQLTGRLPSAVPVAHFQLSSFTLPRKLPLSLPADLVRQRPDIRAAEASLRSANAQIGVAIANRLPQITLTGNAGSTAASLSQLFSPGTGMWMIAGSLAQTVFDAGTLQNRQVAAEAAAAQSVEQYRGVVLAAFRNVADVLRALQADARAIDAATAAERSSSRYIELVRKQVELGQVNIATLITAQQAYLQSSLARVDAQAARLSDTVALFQALGGGWWNRIDPLSGEVLADSPVQQASSQSK